MATVDQSGGVNAYQGKVSARSFVLQRLQNADEPVKPSELADEYGCTNGHMRNVLAELRDEDEVIRVERGLYADAESDFSAENTEYAGPDLNNGGSDAEPDFPEGGDLPSPDTDTADRGNDGDSDVPTDDELDRQREQYSDDDQDEQDGDLDGAELEEASSAPGVPIPVSAGTLVVGLVAAFAVYWLLIRSSDDQREDDQQERQSQPDASGAGLMEVRQ